jgi:hypothetical protein
MKHKLPQHQQDRLEFIDTLEYLDDFISGINCRCSKFKDGSLDECERCQALNLIREQLDCWDVGDWWDDRVRRFTER